MQFSSALLLLTIASSSSASNVIRGRHLKSNDENNNLKKGKNENTKIYEVANLPPLPGIAPGVDRPKLILASGVNNSPYTQLGPVSEDSPLSGFGVDFAQALPEVCNLDVVTVQTQ